MQVIDLPVDAIDTPDWNPNQMDPAMRSRLRESFERFGDIGVLVVRRTGHNRYETIGGAQRLGVLREMEIEFASCVVVEADEARARLIVQVLNNVRGSDDFGRKAEALKLVLESVPRDQVLSLLPETAESLHALSSLTPSSLAGYFSSWEDTRSARLKHGTFQFTPDQLSDVETAIEVALKEAEQRDDNPNRRGNALHHICKSFIEGRAL